MSSPSSWQVVDPNLPVLTHTYKFDGGLAESLVVGGAEGLVVVSPPPSPSEELFADLERYGKPAAFVAPNAFHSLGLPAWKARFPDVDIFAPPQSIARLQSKSRLSGLRPIAEAAPLLGSNLELVDIPHYKTGEALIKVRAASGIIWFVTDALFNLPTLPPSFPFKQIFSWTKSAPGLRPNALAAFLMMKDKSAVYRWLLAEAEKAPPTLLLACHGAPLRMDPPGAQLVELLRSL